VPHALLATVSAALLVAAGLTLTGSGPWQNIHASVAPGTPRMAAPQQRVATAISGPVTPLSTGARSASRILANETLANDNAMLHAIDSVLSAPEPAPVDLSPTSEGYAATHRLATTQGVND
jgi:hypothetical protein